MKSKYSRCHKLVRTVAPFRGTKVEIRHTVAAFFVVPEMVVERRLGVWSCGIPFAEELIAHLWVETDQIKEKKYIASLEPYIGDILLVGINYDKKTKKNECLIEKA